MSTPSLTIIFLTANQLPDKWTEYQNAMLQEAAITCPIITISRKPLDWGMNILDEEPKTASNIYYQMLQGAKKATTEYVAIAEDDTLYPIEHFHIFRPPADAFAYNINRLGLFTWGKPTYFWKDRNSNSTLIAPRKLLIDALEERFARWPEGTPDGITGELGRHNIEDALGVSHRKSIEFETENSVVRLDHKFGLDRLATSKRKRMGIARSFDIPYWGRAEDVVSRFA